MIKKTRLRIMLLMVCVTTLIIAAALDAVYWVTWSNLESANRGRLEAREATRITDDGRVNIGNGDSSAYTVERIASDIGAYFSMFVDAEGRVVSAYTTFTEQSLIDFGVAANIALNGKNYGKAELNGRMWQYAVFREDLNVEIETTLITIDPALGTPDFMDEWTYIRIVDITESRETLDSLARSLIMIGLALFLFFFICSAYFSRLAIRPMIEGLEKQRRFIADASHELKTPVSIIKSNCSALRANEDQTVAEQIEWLDNIETGANRMKELIQSLVTLVKIEGTDRPVDVTLVSPEEKAREALKAFRCMIQNKQLYIEESYAPGATVISDPDRVRQVIDILLDNAIKYADTGGSVRIAVSRERKWLCLSVRNTGAGIAKEDLNKVFDRFYRAESARSHDGSYGLGLSIAMAAMEQLGGTLTAGSVVNEFTVFTARFPNQCQQVK